MGKSKYDKCAQLHLDALNDKETAICTNSIKGVDISGNYLFDDCSNDFEFAREQQI